jgi:monoamine oxidase
MASIDEGQWRVREGYDRLVAHLASAVTIAPGHAVRRVTWRPGAVTVAGVAGAVPFEHHARAVILAVPVALLASIDLDPDVPRLRKDLAMLEMGHALRVVVRLREPLWRRAGLELEPPVFLHAPELPIPTFWIDARAPQLTAWCGGPRAERLARDGHVEEVALSAVATLFDTSRDELARLVAGTHAWLVAGEPYLLGAYPYAVAGAELDGAFAPVDDTIFVAGDFTDPDELGTVGAAVRSGLAAAAALRSR